MKGTVFDLIQRLEQLVCTRSKANRVFDENTSVLFRVRVDHYLVGWITSIHCFIAGLPVLRGLVKLPVSMQQDF
jgi:hypothetical protein